MKRGAVILDVDGTLIDSNGAHAHAWHDAFAEAGITVPYERIRRAIGMGGDKLLPAVAGIEESSPKGRRISERRGEIFKTRYLSTIQPFSDVRELAEQFRSDGLVLVVASSAPDDELHALLERAGIVDLVADRTSSDDADESKPAPDIVEAALKSAGVSPQRALMLGDTPYDVEAASRARIGIVALECGGWPASELRGADAVYASPAELLAQYDASPFARLRSRQHVQA